MTVRQAVDALGVLSLKLKMRASTTTRFAWPSHGSWTHWLSVETVSVLLSRNFNTLRERSTESGARCSWSFHAFL